MLAWSAVLTVLMITATTATRNKTRQFVVPIAKPAGRAGSRIGPADYTIVTTDTTNCNKITSLSQCTAAVEALSILDDDGAEDDGYTSGTSIYPSGCYWYYDSVKFNVDMSNTGDCDWWKQCICINECSNNDGCSDHLACTGGKCVDACADISCKHKEVCSATNHKGACSAPKGYPDFVDVTGWCAKPDGSIAYDDGNYGYRSAYTEAECWDYCESWNLMNLQSITSTTYVACEWDSSNEYCNIYHPGHEIIGGDGDIDSICRIYTTGCGGVDGTIGDGTEQLLCTNPNHVCQADGNCVEAGAWHYPESMSHGWANGGHCTGSMQSPIDLHDNLMAIAHSPIEYRNYFVNPNDNNRFYDGMLENNGHSVVWHLHDDTTTRLHRCWPQCPSIRNGPFGGVKHTHAYYLLQLHFHWGSPNGKHWNKGSEHTVDGKQYPLEMHMVHIEDKYIDAAGTYDWAGAIADPMGLAVLGFFFQVDNTKPQNMQPLETIDQLVDNLKNDAGKRRKREVDDDNAQREEMTRFHAAFEQLFANEDNDQQRVKRSHGQGDMHKILKYLQVPLRLNPGAFIRKATNRGYHKNDYSTYWTYHGSLTTPTCNEVVTWVVFSRALHIAQVQVNAFTHKFPNNFRQPSTMLGSHTEDRKDTMCGREIRFIHDQIEHHMGGFWG